jgi:hypothetical protein
VNGTYGEALLRVHVNENNNQRFYAAIDAGQGSSGKTVCRVTLTNPTLLPGCVPMNIMGAGAPSAAAIAYTQGDSSYRVNNSTGIISGNFVARCLSCRPVRCRWPWARKPAARPCCSAPIPTPLWPPR